MFKNEMKTRMMAFAVVAMFMVTAFSVGSINTDATEDGTLANPYIIYITENDQFSYTPTVNLSENTTLTAMQGTESNAINTALSMTTNNDSGLTFSGTTLSATSIKYGIWYVQIHASWSLTVHGTVLSQTADQYIIFYVSHDLSIVASDNKVTFALDEHSLTSNTTLSTASIQYKMDNQESNAVSWTISDENNFSISSVTGDSTSLSIKADTTHGTYNVTLTASQTSNHGLTTQSKNINYVITVYNGATEIAADPLYFVTYIDDDTAANISKTAYFNGNFKTTTKWSAADTELTSGTTATDIFTFNQSEAEIGTEYTDQTPLTVTIDNSANKLSKYGLNTSDSGPSTGSVTYSVSGNSTNATDSPTRTLSFVAQYSMYPALIFTNTPTVANVTVTNSSINVLDTILAANVSGATKVTFDWGDNSPVDVQDVNSKHAVLTGTHSYAKVGTYIIRVTAENDFGSTTYDYMFSTDEDAVLSPAPTYEVTIKDGSDASKLVGSITVEEGKSFAIEDITIDSDYNMSKKKIVNLYTEPAGSDGKFDAEKLWKSTDKVTSDKTLYAEIEDKSSTDSLFGDYGVFILIILVILVVIAMLAAIGILPQMLFPFAGASALLLGIVSVGILIVNLIG